MHSNDFFEKDNDLALNVLQQIPTPIMAVNRSLELMFINRAGLNLLGNHLGRYSGKALRRGVSTPPLRQSGLPDAAGHRRGQEPSPSEIH